MNVLTGEVLHMDEVPWYQNKSGHRMRYIKMENIICFSRHVIRRHIGNGVATDKTCQTPAGKFIPEKN